MTGKILSKIKNQKITAEMIHADFYDEAKKLLVQAQEQIQLLSLNKTAKINENLEKKAKKLKLLGFYKAALVKQVAELKEYNRIQERQSENVKREIDILMYFQSKYPQYKYIPESSVKKLCEKYGLIYGSVADYIGNIPDKNLHDIESFKISDADKAYLRDKGSWQSLISYEEMMRIRDQRQRSRMFDPAGLTSGSALFGDHTYTQVAPLEIAAPPEDFNKDGKVVEDHQLKNKVEDPIVLQPVFYNNTKGYLIVTAWGDEAKDELVINQKNN